MALDNKGNVTWGPLNEPEQSSREDTILNRLFDSVQELLVIEDQVLELADRLVGERVPEDAPGTGKRIPSAGGAFGQVDEAASHISYAVSRMSDNIARIARLI